MAIGRHDAAEAPRRVDRRLPPEELFERSVRLVRDTVDGAEADGAVVALSGGVDSATTAALAVEALGAGNVFALLMPTADTPEGDTVDAREWARTLGIDHATVALDPAMEVFKRHVAPRIAPAGDEYAAGNLAARLRMACAYFVANTTDRLVVGTANRTERMLGYFTKYGDGGVDLLPLGEYDKGEVRSLAAHLGVPERIRAKPPSAGFWRGQTDEADLGATYPTLDRVVAALVDDAGGRVTAATTERLGTDAGTVAEQAARLARTGHKRERPPTPPRPLPGADDPVALATAGDRLATAHDDVTRFVGDYVDGAGAEGVVVPLSGGLDSSVAAALAVEALGPDRVYAVHLPCHKAVDIDTPDPESVAADLGIEFDRVNVRPLVTELESQLPHEITKRAGVRELANLVARVRMASAYYVANTATDLVVGTTDRSDLLLGDVTKYGDGAGDLLPLGGLYRSEVAALGRRLGLADGVVDQPATVEFAAGRLAETEHGASYDTIDRVLDRLVDRDIGIARTAAELELEPALVRRFAGAHVDSKHKRSLPPTTEEAAGPGPFHELELKFE
ncbi:NAD+ synthase [Halobaculum lipolyticum]|uniref:NH(3)-dependent NAD(+) synthetase n=1 Tax=Halobaculum lipolyticum TaxID=3032001 RepID=A0ABD5W9E4_9EURY|nr:NAD+ synthase [Halobaculum sp. DT31]